MSTLLINCFYYYYYYYYYYYVQIRVQLALIVWHLVSPQTLGPHQQSAAATGKELLRYLFWEMWDGMNKAIYTSQNTAAGLVIMSSILLAYNDVKETVET